MRKYLVTAGLILSLVWVVFWVVCSFYLIVPDLYHDVESCREDLRGQILALAASTGSLTRSVSSCVPVRNESVMKLERISGEIFLYSSSADLQMAYSELTDSASSLISYMRSLPSDRVPLYYRDALEYYGICNKNVEVFISRYNVAVKKYNDMIHRFPYFCVHEMFGYSEIKYFE